MIHETAFVHHTAVVYPGVSIGPNVYIGPMCVIGSFAEHPNGKHDGGSVVIAEGAVLTKLVTVDASTDGTTFVGSDCYLMAHSHVGHDARLGDGTILACGAKIGGGSKLGAHCNVGLNAVVHQGSDLADGTMIGASAFFKGINFERFAIFAGVPAKYIKRNEILIERLQAFGVLDHALAFTGQRIRRSPGDCDKVV